MAEDDSSDDPGDDSSKKEILGGKHEKGFSNEEAEGSEGGYGFIRPSAESDNAENSDSDPE